MRKNLGIYLNSKDQDAKIQKLEKKNVQTIYKNEMENIATTTSTVWPIINSPTLSSPVGYAPRTSEAPVSKAAAPSNRAPRRSSSTLPEDPWGRECFGAGARWGSGCPCHVLRPRNVSQWQSHSGERWEAFPRQNKHCTCGGRGGRGGGGSQD